MLRIEHVHVVELLRTFRTILEHGAHRGIAVDIGILSLDVGIRRILERDVLQNAHEPSLRLAGTAALRTVEDVCLRRSGIALANQHALHSILYAFHRGHVDAFVAGHFTRDKPCKALGLFPALCASRIHKGTHNCVRDFVIIIWYGSSVSLDNEFRLHRFSSLHCRKSLGGL